LAGLMVRTHNPLKSNPEPLFKLKVAVITLIFFSSTSFFKSQNFEKMDALLEHPGSKFETIYRGRNEVYQRFIEKDTATVIELLKYFKTVIEDDKTLAFYPEEYCLYDYWLGRYSNITAFTITYDSNYIQQLSSKKLPPNDFLLEKLIDRIRMQRQSVYSQIKANTVLTQEEKDLLILNFDQHLSWGLSKDACVETLNLQRENFLSKYPNSTYFNYVKDFTGLAFETKNWTVSAEYFTGLGSYSGTFGKTLAPIVPVGITFDFRYKHFSFGLIDYIGFTKTRDTINTLKSLWKPNYPARLFMLGASLGYNIIDQEKIKLRPFVGYYSSSLLPPLFVSGKNENKDLGLNFTSSFAFGISTDFFVKTENETEYNWNSRDLHYFRLTYHYVSSPFERKYPTLTGNFHTFTLGYAMLSSSKRRVR
jgi:hypothetical protein